MLSALTMVWLLGFFLLVFLAYSFQQLTGNYTSYASEQILSYYCFRQEFCFPIYPLKKEIQVFHEFHDAYTTHFLFFFLNCHLLKGFNSWKGLSGALQKYMKLSSS